MKNHLVIIELVVILVCIGLSGCTQVDHTLNYEESKFVGTWLTYEDIACIDLGGRVVFFSDGTVTLKSGFRGKYQVDEGNYLIVHITINGNKTQHLFDYEFSDNGNTLKLLYLTTGRMYSYTRE